MRGRIAPGCTVRQTAQPPNRRFLRRPDERRRDRHDDHQRDREQDSAFRTHLGNRIVTARMKRMTTKYATRTQPAAFQRTVALHCFVRVARTRWLEATLRKHQMRQRELIPTDECHHRHTWQSSQRHVSVSSTPVNSARRTANGAAYAERFARITRSTAGRFRSKSRRRISRSRRRKRLRATAED